MRYESAERSGDINQGFHHVLVPPRVEFQPALVQFVFWITASDGFKVEKRENTHTHFQYTFHLSCVCVLSTQQPAEKYDFANRPQGVEVRVVLLQKNRV